MYDELEKRLLMISDLDGLVELGKDLDHHTSEKETNNIVQEFRAIVSTLINHSNILNADAQSHSNNLYAAIKSYLKINVSTNNMSTLLFFQFSYNYAVTLCKVIGKEKEGLLRLNDALTILSTLPEPLLTMLKLKTIKAIILAHYSLMNYPVALSYIDEYLKLCSPHEDIHYDMLCSNACLLFEMGQYSKTVTVTTNAISNKPSRSQAYGLRAEAKLKLFLKKEALLDYQTQQNLNPGTHVSPLSKRSDLLNLSSILNLDSYESYLIPTSQLPGHIAFENQSAKPELSLDTPKLSIDHTLASVKLGDELRSPIANHISSPISGLPPYQKLKLTREHRTVVGDIMPVPTPHKKHVSEHVASDGHNSIPKFYTVSSNKPLRHVSPVNLAIKTSISDSSNTSAFGNDNIQFLDAKPHFSEEKLQFSVQKAQRHIIPI